MIVIAGLILLGVKLIVLGWAFWKTRQLATIVYAIYLIGGMLVGTWMLPLAARFLTFAYWFLGRDPTSIMDNLTTTCESIATLVNDGLLIWVLWSLTGQYRR